jgi:Holliday junction resolvase RusA-like endonuclease
VAVGAPGMAWECDGAQMKIIIPGEFTSLNEYINAERGNKFHAAKIKDNETYRVWLECVNLPTIREFPVTLLFDWYTKDSRKDADNIDFAKKFILDGLVRAGVLPDDSRKYVIGTSCLCHVDKENPRVEIQIVGA